MSLLEQWLQTVLTAEVCLQEAAADAAKAQPARTNAAVSCSDAATQDNTDSRPIASESTSPKRGFMQLYSAREINEDVTGLADHNKDKLGHQDAGHAQAGLSGSEHAPLPAIPEIAGTSDESLFGVTKALLQRDFASISR